MVGVCRCRARGQSLEGGAEIASVARVSKFEVGKTFSTPGLTVERIRRATAEAIYLLLVIYLLFLFLFLLFKYASCAGSALKARETRK